MGMIWRKWERHRSPGWRGVRKAAEKKALFRRFLAHPSHQGSKSILQIGLFPTRLANDGGKEGRKWRGEVEYDTEEECGGEGCHAVGVCARKRPTAWSLNCEGGDRSRLMVVCYQFIWAAWVFFFTGDQFLVYSLSRWLMHMSLWLYLSCLPAAVPVFWMCLFPSCPLAVAFRKQMFFF